jgi:phosphatidylserine/phosphatidylglycerophosphate/cardiolipin synthase-like enzyme
MHTKAVFENIANRIETEIDKAQKSVLIAVAWFTNKNLFEAIVRKSKKGCQISLMITDDKINNNSGIDYNRLTTANSQIYKIGNGNND